jgi:uncharacterized protein YjaG (DUF416 family)
MKWTKYKNQLEQNIEVISFTQKLEFAIEICERLLPDYEKFTEKYNWGNLEPIKSGITLCKQCFNGIEFEFETLRNLIAKIDENTPDMDEFGHDILGSLALNSACVVNETLTFLIDKKNDRIVDVGILCYDTQYFKVSEKCENFTDAEIENNTDLNKEINWQLERTRYVA